MSKLPKSALSLKQFMLRQEVMKLYRDIFRALRLVQDSKTKTELRDWAKTDFRNNMQITDETAIKVQLYYGKKSLENLERSLAMSRSSDNKTK